MEYRGTFNDGIIRPDQPLDLPNGTPVEFHPVNGRDRAAFPGTAQRSPTPIEELERLDRASRSPSSLEELAREQGAGPIRSLDDLGGQWPDDGDDIDEFLRSVREGRR